MIWLRRWLEKPRTDQSTSTSLDISVEARDKLCKALRADNLVSVQDLLNCLLLSECVYKAHDLGPQQAVKSLKSFQEHFPPGLTSIQAVQCSLPHVHHRYLVATSPRTVYVSFIGTKLAKDIFVDVNLLRRPLWQATEQRAGLPAAHRGFLQRSKRVPVEQILVHAQKGNRKLVLCGHSLGGAVATLCTLRVLQQASDAGQPKPAVKCITFGAPAIGNSALASTVVQKGWKDCFHNVVLPEDLVPRLLALRPEASSAELSMETRTQAALPLQGSWFNPGFARLANYRTSLSRGLSSAAAAEPSHPPGTAPPPFSAAITENEPPDAEVEGLNSSEAGNCRQWTLPQRLWQRGSSQSSSLDSNTLPPRITKDAKAEATAQAEQQEEVQSDLPAEENYSSGWHGALQSVGRRVPLQGWWHGGGQSEVEGPKSQSHTGTEEDGAVDALVEGLHLDTSTEKAASNRMTWLRRLSQLQNLAVSAASSVGGIGKLLPTNVHVGQTVTWNALEQVPDLPEAFPTGDVRSRLLANHRMPAYRLRALAHCAATPGLPQPHQGSSSAQLSDAILPPVTLHQAVANLGPLAPTNAAGSRWSWIPYMGGETAWQMPELAVRLEVEGEGVGDLRQGRMLAYGSTWCPVRILEDDRARPPLATNGSGDKRELLPPRGPFGAVEWLLQRWQRPLTEQPLVVEARLPGPVATQVYHGHSGSADPALELHLRSDFSEVAIPVSIRLPTVWVLGSSAAAAKRLMSALSTQASVTKSSTIMPLQPAELVLDGSKWYNLLAAPVTTPNQALNSLSHSLPNRIQGPGTTGPLRLADSLRKGLQAWLVGTQINLGEGSSCAAIVLAVDNPTTLPRRQLTSLISQANSSGVQLITIHVGGKGFQDQQSQNTVLSDHQRMGSLTAESILNLRQEVFQALSGQQMPLQPRAKL